MFFALHNGDNSSDSETEQNNGAIMNSESQTPEASGPSVRVRKYISPTEAYKFIGSEFSGKEPERLPEFVQNVETAKKLVNPEERELFYKLILTKITGDARTKIIARGGISDWEDVRSALEEFYLPHRTLTYHACKLFAIRQGPQETVAEWAHKIDRVTNDLRDACIKDVDVQTANCYTNLVTMFSKASFMQGLKDPKIKQLVKSKDPGSFSETVNLAIEEESEIASETEGQKFMRATLVRPQSTSSWGHVHRTPTSPSRNSWNIKNSGKSGTSKTNLSRQIHVVCFKCNKTGHIAKDCRQESKAKSARNITCNYCKKQGHVISECRKREHNRSQNTRRQDKNEIFVCEVIRCYNCGKMGHTQQICKAPRKEHYKRACFSCGKTSHVARNCWNNQNSRRPYIRENVGNTSKGNTPNHNRQSKEWASQKSYAQACKGDASRITGNQKGIFGNVVGTKNKNGNTVQNRGLNEVRFTKMEQW